jgi:hypothetical protein
VREARALLGKRVRLAKPPGTLGWVIEVAQPMWLFARQDGNPQPEHTMEISAPILTIVWDIPNSEDTLETVLHWEEFLGTVSEA